MREPRLGADYAARAYPLLQAAPNQRVAVNGSHVLARDRGPRPIPAQNRADPTGPGRRPGGRRMASRQHLPCACGLRHRHLGEEVLESRAKHYLTVEQYKTNNLLRTVTSHDVAELAAGCAVRCFARTTGVGPNRGSSVRDLIWGDGELHSPGLSRKAEANPRATIERMSPTQMQRERRTSKAKLDAQVQCQQPTSVCGTACVPLQSGSHMKKITRRQLQSQPAQPGIVAVACTPSSTPHCAHEHRRGTGSRLRQFPQQPQPKRRPSLPASIRKRPCLPSAVQAGKLPPVEERLPSTPSWYKPAARMAGPGSRPVAARSDLPDRASSMTTTAT